MAGCMYRHCHVNITHHPPKTDLPCSAFSLRQLSYLYGFFAIAKSCSACDIGRMAADVTKRSLSEFRLRQICLLIAINWWSWHTTNTSDYLSLLVHYCVYIHNVAVPCQLLLFHGIHLCLSWVSKDMINLKLDMITSLLSSQLCTSIDQQWSETYKFPWKQTLGVGTHLKGRCFAFFV